MPASNSVHVWSGPKAYTLFSDLETVNLASTDEPPKILKSLVWCVNLKVCVFMCFLGQRAQHSWIYRLYFRSLAQTSSLPFPCAPLTPAPDSCHSSLYFSALNLLRFHLHMRWHNARLSVWFISFNVMSSRFDHVVTSDTISCFLIIC